MAILAWMEEFNVGIASIDEQHRQLVEIINQLDEAVAIGSEQKHIAELMTALINYAEYHFKHEEDLMASVDYDRKNFAEHRNQHQDFTAQIHRAQQIAVTNPESITRSLLDFLVDWLCSHILGVDKKMAMAINHYPVTSPVVFKQQQSDIMQNNLFSALRESESRFRELADLLPCLIWISNSKLVPIFCNHFGRKIFGLSKTELDQASWLQQIDVRDRDKVSQAYQHASQQQGRVSLEYRLPQADGSTRWILESVAARQRHNGKFLGLMGCGMDITLQKLAEEKLEQQVAQRTQQLQQAISVLAAEKDRQLQLNHQLKEAQSHLIQSEKMASIGQLAAGVAHEINNPLGYIYSNLNTLREYLVNLLRITQAARQLAEQLPKDFPGSANFMQLIKSLDLDLIQTDLPDLVAEAMEGAVRAKKIVQDLRDFSRIDSQEKAFFDIEAGLDSTLNIVNNELKFKAEVIKEYGGLQPLLCIGAQLNQVFMNLLINAAQAMKEFGKITVRTGYENADWLWVEIEDNGCGIPEAIQSKIFDPFFTTKPIGQGTGLGLSLSYKIIKDHGGHIDLISVPGSGSKFRINLPCH